MAKLCPKGKAAAKRKFKVYPSAYANMYASKVCKGKVRSSAKDGGKVKPTPGPKAGKPKMGRHWSTKEEWQVSTLWKKICFWFQTKISKVRTTCKSHTDDKRRKGICCQQKTSGR